MKTKKDNIARSDWKYMEQNPYGDADFDPEHNKRIIAEVDAWNDQMEERKEREFKEKIQERTNAVAQYLQNITKGQGINNIQKYFGKRYLAYLRGEEIVRQLKSNPELVEKIKQKMEKKGTLQSL